MVSSLGYAQLVIREMLQEVHGLERRRGRGNKEEQPDKIHRPNEMVVWGLLKLSAFICTCEN